MKKEEIAKEVLKIAKELIAEEDWRDIFQIEELERLILKEFDEYASKVKLTFNYNAGRKRIQVDSNNVAQYTGIMKKNFAKLQIGNFGGSADIEKRTAFIPIAFGFKYFNGGENGIEIADFSFKDGKWMKR